MKQKGIFLVIVILLLLTACGQGSRLPSDELNIMCEKYEAKIFGELYFAHDGMKPNCIAPEYDTVSMSEWKDKRNLYLMSRSPDVDIYLLHSTDADAYKIIQDCFYVDQGQDEEIAKCFNAMPPEIQAWCTRDGEVFGFPSEIDFPMHIFAEPNMIYDAGYRLTDIGTIDGFLDFCGRWTDGSVYAAAQTDKSPTGHLLKVRDYYLNYMYAHYNRADGSLNFDTPVFRHILTQCRELYLHEELFKADPGDYFVVSEITNANAPLFLNCFQILPRNKDYRPVTYPKLEGEDTDAGRYVDICWLIVNPAGRHIEEAMAYMRRWAKLLETELIIIHYDDSYDVSMDRLNTIGSFLGEHDVAYGFPADQAVFDIFDRYVYDGSIELDEAIAEAQRIFDIARQEQYIGK